VKLGARSLGRYFERNIRLDDAGQTLLRTKSLLRLRQDRKSTLTYKSIPSNADPAFKQLLEVEVEVGDFDAMVCILGSLGFHPQQVYEKWRESLVLEHTVFCLDTLPFGDFLEIEGSKADIAHFADRLGLDWRRRILVTYLDVFDMIRTDQNLPFSDATFSNFAACPVDVGSYLHFLEAGPASGQGIR
jgi:adenylate cyclase class 2